MKGRLFRMDNKALILISMLLISPVTQAEIFKCVGAGKTVFSDKPCADDAEKLELKLYKPKAEDIEKQQQTTQQYQRDSRHNDFLSLRSENERLEKQITQLQKEHDQKLKEMSGNIYRSGEYIATKEHGLFKRMRQVSAEYKNKIEQVENQIESNKAKMDQLQSGQ